MAPEQVEGTKVDERCDLFSLGCVLYVMCTGTLAFHRNDMVGTLLAVATHHPTPPADLGSGLPPGLSDLVMRLLAKKQENRPLSANAVVDEIRAIEEGKPAPVFSLPAEMETSSPHQAESRTDGNAANARKRGAPSTAAKRPMSRKAKMAAVGGLFMAVVGGIVWWIVWWIFSISPAKPVYFVLIGAGYEKNLAIPHNAYGLEGINGVEVVLKANKKLGRVDRMAYPASWRHALQEFKDKDREKTVVLYLALHGGADNAGPYLLFDTTPSKDDKSLLRIGEVLKELKKLPPEKKKLLILAATQIQHCPRLMIANDFSRKLEGMDGDIKDVSNLVVLSSTDHFQRSWTSNEWRQSAFGHFVQEGLKGAADLRHSDEGGVAGDGNGRVTALELYKFVRERVRRWAHDNRDAAQTPVLLPRGKEGEDRARPMELVVADDAYSPSPVPSVRPLPSDLEKYWKEKEELARLVPAPALYSPQIWSQYLATLLRYEQLVRAGATGVAGELADKNLTHYRTEILKAKTLGAETSSQNALPIPQAYGLLRRNLLDGSEFHFGRLWSAPNANKQKTLWNGLVTDDKEKVLPMRLCAWLLNKCIGNSADLPKASALIRNLLGSKDMPAEAQNLVVWEENLSELFGKEMPASLALALKTRRLAEEAALGVPEARTGLEAGKRLAHPHSEFVRPWIEAKIVEADEARRAGQDKLFSALPADVIETENRLTEAVKLYGEAVRTAAIVRDGLETRAEVMSELPFYADWLALRRPGDDTDFPDYLSLLKRVETLWESVHTLNALLGSAAARTDAQTDQLRDLAGTTRDGFAVIKGRFSTYSGTPHEQETQSDWHALEGMLTLPFINALRRVELLRASARISRALNARASSKGVGANTDTEAAARMNAERLARVTLARLGDAELFSEMKDRLPGLQGNRWQHYALAFGEEIGYRWRGLPDKINKHADLSLKNTTIADAVREMAQADRLCRLIDASGVDQLKANLNPVTENRRLHMHNLLVWLADRTLQDRCFGPGPDNQPYYRVAGVKYVRDAMEMAAVKDEEAKALRERVAVGKRRELTAPVYLKFTWSESGLDDSFKDSAVDFHVTSEKEYDLFFRIRPTGISSGFPVVFVKPGNVDLEDPKELEKLRRPESRSLADGVPTPVALKQGKNPFYKELFDRKVPPATTSQAGQPLSASVHGLFRGYRFSLDASVHLHRRANTIVYQNPLPNKGAVLIFADDAMHRKYSPREGSVAILVDMSGSFQQAANGKKSRFQQATEALDAMLDTFTPGLEAQLWIFSGKPKNGPNLNRNQANMIASTKKWTGENKNDFLGALKKWVPDGGSPLVKGLEVVAEALAKSARRTQTLIVVTDGGDDHVKDGAKRIKGIFANKRIAVHLVGFHLDAKQRADFNLVAREVETLTPAGEVHDVAKKQDLAEILGKALRWTYQLGKPRGVKQKNALVKEIGRGGMDNWLEVEPGTYEIRVNNFLPVEKLRPIAVAAGQLRIYQLKDDTLTPALYAKNGKVAWPRKDGWQLAVINNFKKGKAQEFLTVIENFFINERGEDAIPGQVWLEVYPPKGDPKEDVSVAGVRWGNQLGYPAPVWKVASARGLDKSVLKAWTRHKAFDVDPIFREKNQALESFNNKTRTLEGKTDIIIESVKIEDFPVVDALGNRDATKTMPCVVVRMSYPKGKPALVQPYPLVDPTVGGGYEHHFYAEAGGNRGKYTGIFWYGQDLDTNIKAKVTALRPYAVAGFKASDATTAMEVNLGKPEAAGRVGAFPRFLAQLGLR
jgi:hypothetical protein